MTGSDDVEQPLVLEYTACPDDTDLPLPDELVPWFRAEGTAMSTRATTATDDSWATSNDEQSHSRTDPPLFRRWR